MCGYFCIGFIDFMFKGKSLTEYTNLFSPNDFKRNDDTIFRKLRLNNKQDEEYLETFFNDRMNLRNICSDFPPNNNYLSLEYRSMFTNSENGSSVRSETENTVCDIGTTIFKQDPKTKDTLNYLLAPPPSSSSSSSSSRPIFRARENVLKLDRSFLFLILNKHNVISHIGCCVDPLEEIQMFYY